MTWAAIVGGGISALGSAGGSYLSASKSGSKASPQTVSGFDPRADPLLSLLNAQSMAELGFGPDINTLRASSPLNRLENSLIGALSGKGSKKNLTVLNMAIQEANKAIAAGDATAAAAALEKAFPRNKGKSQLKLMDAALSSAGFGSITDLMQEELSYRQRADAQTSMLTAQAVPRAEARQAANATINRLLTDYPAYGASDLDKAIADAMKPINAQTLEQANYLGYNPATNVALTQQQGIRDALSILGGRQQLSNTALNELNLILGAQTESARGTSGQNLSALAQASNTASQQAMALNALAQQGNLYQATAAGGGVAAGVNQLGNTISGLGVQPGTSTQGTRYQLGTAQYGPYGGGGSDVSGNW